MIAHVGMIFLNVNVINHEEQKVTLTVKSHSVIGFLDINVWTMCHIPS